MLKYNDQLAKRYGANKPSFHAAVETVGIPTREDQWPGFPEVDST